MSSSRAPVRVGRLVYGGRKGPPVKRMVLQAPPHIRTVAALPVRKTPLNSSAVRRSSDYPCRRSIIRRAGGRRDSKESSQGSPVRPDPIAIRAATARPPASRVLLIWLIGRGTAEELSSVVDGFLGAKRWKTRRRGCPFRRRILRSNRANRRHEVSRPTVLPSAAAQIVERSSLTRL